MPTQLDGPASKSQTRAIFFASGLDARPLNLTYAQASSYIDALKDASTAAEAIASLVERGAPGEPKRPKVVRDAEHASLWERAWAAGVEAAKACTPEPMIVEEHENQLDDNSPVVARYGPIAAGICGFAAVRVVPGNSSFARWLTSARSARPHHRGGIQVFISAYEQSYERKTAHAQAMAGVLREAGVNAYTESRLD